MKIAIASDDGKTIASHFGRTKGFVVLATDGDGVGDRGYLPNTFTGHALGLEGTEHEVDRHAPILDALADCQVVISHGMGRRMYDDLKQTDIEVFITDETDAERAAELYIQGELTDSPDRACNHSHA